MKLGFPESTIYLQIDGKFTFPSKSISDTKTINNHTYRIVKNSNSIKVKNRIRNFYDLVFNLRLQNTESIITYNQSLDKLECVVRLKLLTKILTILLFLFPFCFCLWYLILEPFIGLVYFFILFIVIALIYLGPLRSSVMFMRERLNKDLLEIVNLD